MADDRNKQIMAANIRRHMDAKGVTNQQLCDALGFKYTTFLDWIKGVTYPRIGKVEAMANYFGCEKSDLIEEKSEEQRAIEQKNDALSDIIIRLRTDSDFWNVVQALDELDSEKLASVKQMLSAFAK